MSASQAPLDSTDPARGPESRGGVAQSPATVAAVAHRSKLLAGLLASVLGAFGVHRWYLGQRHAWLMAGITCLLIVLVQFYPVWWDNPPFLLLFVMVTAGNIEALVISLRSDEAFDARYNQGSGKTTRTGWGPVLVAIGVTFIGSSVLVLGISMAVLHVYTALGWLDGYVL